MSRRLQKKSGKRRRAGFFWRQARACPRHWLGFHHCSPVHLSSPHSWPEFLAWHAEPRNTVCWCCNIFAVRLATVCDWLKTETLNRGAPLAGRGPDPHRDMSWTITKFVSSNRIGSLRCIIANISAIMPPSGAATRWRKPAIWWRYGAASNVSMRGRRRQHIETPASRIGIGAGTAGARPPGRKEDKDRVPQLQRDFKGSCV